jgi:hypothetical protein
MSAGGENIEGPGPKVIPLAPARSRFPEWTLALMVALVPVLSAWIGGRFIDSAARRSANAQLIEIAVGVLQQDPVPESSDLRNWAVDVLDHYSEVPFSVELRKSLTDSIALPITLTPAPSPARISWLLPDGGTITPNGLFSAVAPGRYRIIACMTGRNLCDTTVAVVGATPPGASNRR